MTYDVGLSHCAIPECPATVKDHYWGRVKATGWFFSKKDALAYCPEHVPSWVAEWRRRRDARYDL